MRGNEQGGFGDPRGSVGREGSTVRPSDGGHEGRGRQDNDRHLPRSRLPHQGRCQNKTYLTLAPNIFSSNNIKNLPKKNAL